MSDCGCHSHNGFLTERGYELAQQNSLEGLAPRGESAYVDKVGSVSASDGPPGPLFVDEIIEEQNRRFFHGS